MTTDTNKPRRFTAQMQNIIKESERLAISLGRSDLDVPLILMGTLKYPACVASRKLAEDFDITPESYESMAGIKVPEGTTSKPDPIEVALNEDVKKLITHSVYSSRKEGAAFIGTEHLYQALLNNPDLLASALIGTQAS